MPSSVGMCEDPEIPMQVTWAVINSSKYNASIFGGMEQNRDENFHRPTIGLWQSLGAKQQRIAVNTEHAKHRWHQRLHRKLVSVGRRPLRGATALYSQRLHLGWCRVVGIWHTVPSSRCQCLARARESMFRVLGMRAPLSMSLLTPSRCLLEPPS